MTYKTLLLSKARKELANGWQWYEERHQGLGDRFVKVVLEKITQIENTPKRYPIRIGQYHEATVPVFPYLVIYRINKSKNLVIVAGIFHTKRNPLKKVRD